MKLNFFLLIFIIFLTGCADTTKNIIIYEKNIGFKKNALGEYVLIPVNSTQTLIDENIKLSFFYKV